MAQLRRGPSPRETLVSWVILGGLLVILGGVCVKQSFYDPALFKVGMPQAPGQAARTAEALPDLAANSPASSLKLTEFLGTDMKVLSPPESFGPETLSDKIDGKAELYLSAGFVSLVCQRFVRNEDAREWLEIFVYDMGAHKPAFSVYSAQRRSEAESSDLTPFAYKTQNALYWIHGKYYVEAIASVASPAMMESMTTFGKRFIAGTKAETEEIGELGLFPPDHLVEGSVTLLSSDVFSFQSLENVYTAHYVMDGETLTAFLSRKESPREAEKLVEAYHAFLLENGGADTPLEVQIPGAVLVKIMDTFEIIFHHGPYIAGVHEAESLAAARKLAVRLEAKLAEAVK